MSNDSNAVSPKSIWQARKRIKSLVNKTPLIVSPVLSELTQSAVYLKLENMHATGAFKIRGAANKILSLPRDEQERGVATFSTGNHGMAVAYVAQQLGIQAVICISDHVPEAKVKAIRQYGAQILICGQSQDDAERRCYELQKEQGLTVVKPFDDPEVIAGQGTIGLEILEDLPEVDTVVAGLSGGGLVGGIALSLKSVDEHIEIVGVSMKRGAAMHDSLAAGKPVAVEEHNTLADSLLGGIGENNRFTFELIRKYADQTLLVSEEAIAEGMAYMLQQHKMVVEGAAAIGIGAVMHDHIIRPGTHNVIIISGRNTDLSAHLEATRKYIL